MVKIADRSVSGLKQLASSLVGPVRSAGAEILAIHESGAKAEFKSDGSPVTAADKAAEAILLPALAGLAPDLPVISEENETSHRLSAEPLYFLVDPLDGTKEFIKPGNSGAFTVNVALIADRQPVMGLVFAPMLDRLFIGVAGGGAMEITPAGAQSIHTRAVPATGPVAVASSSHMDEATRQWLANRQISQTISIGSSLKFCLVANGEADLYPRFGPTMEWDTAAGDAVLRAAGGGLQTESGDVFQYGKPGWRNHAFIAASDDFFKMI